MENEIKGYKLMRLGYYLEIGMLLYFLFLFFLQDLTPRLIVLFILSFMLSVGILTVEAISIKKINVTRKVLPLLFLLPLFIIIDVFVLQWTLLSPFGQILMFIGAVQAANQGLSYYEHLSNNKHD